MKDFRTRFDEWFYDLPESERMSVYNEYANANAYEPVYYTDEFDEILSDTEPIRVAMMVRFGDFNPNHDYFTFDGRGNLESIESIYRWADVDELAEFFEFSREVLERVAVSDCWDLYDEDEEED